MRIALLAFVLLTGCGANAAEAEEIEIGKRVYQPFFKDIGDSDQEIGPLRVDRDPVTNQDYLEWLRSRPDMKRSRIPRLYADRSYLKHWTGDDGFDPAIARHPVTNVSWFAARKYCESKGKRLLTVAEWETVSDAQNAKLQSQILGWYAKPGNTLKTVEEAETNDNGLRAMHGVTWEWVEDFSSVIVAGDSRNGNDTKATEFCGAGSLRAKDPAQYAAFVRFAMRSSLKAPYTGENLGFRCARD